MAKKAEWSPPSLESIIGTTDEKYWRCWVEGVGPRPLNNCYLYPSEDSALRFMRTNSNRRIVVIDPQGLIVDESAGEKFKLVATPVGDKGYRYTLTQEKV